ncbi:MAG: putative selenium-dependent hydroxylase accessory protein YqeC [Ectothiorhodospiraceae bacterium]|nr:putative selenium-dependent hydroxylase accessory protein YqeC [Chromatiales bacterium]MCP5154212.1 putative selenium-dependent hydroxylase accessory protein YqeC [Ectothiorhodospiraceae bacterium]
MVEVTPSGAPLPSTALVRTRVGLLDALGAADGIVCLVGAGGKKTLMRRLVEAHEGRVALTCTGKLVPFEAAVPFRWLALGAGDDGAAVVAAARTERVVAYCGPSDGRRNLGLPPALVADLHRRCGVDVTFVKADGARMRRLKGRHPSEPPLVPGVTTVVSLCSIAVVGQPLDERLAHRPELVAVHAGARLGEPLTEAHLARLVRLQAAELRVKSGARVVPVLNMVDDPAAARTAETVARLALAGPGAPEAVVLTALATDPVEVLRLAPGAQPAPGHHDP